MIGKRPKKPASPARAAIIFLIFLVYLITSITSRSNHSKIQTTQAVGAAAVSTAAAKIKTSSQPEPAVKPSAAASAQDSKTSSAVQAASKGYYLREPGMTVNLPPELMVFTRETSANDPNLRKIGQTSDVLMDRFNKGGIYLEAVPEDKNYNIYVTMQETNESQMIFDYRSISASNLIKIEESNKESLANNGNLLKSMDIVNTNQAVYIRTYYGTAGSNYINYLGYKTVLDGKYITVTLISMNGEISKTAEAVMSNMIKSISYDVKAAPGVIELNGLRLGYPAGFVPGTSPKINLYFTISGKSGENFIIISRDIYSGLPLFEKLGVSSSHIKSEYFSIGKINDIFSKFTSAKLNLSAMSIGGRKYYINTVNTSYSSEFDGPKVTKQLLTIQNGWAYFYEYRYRDGNAYHYSAFTDMLGKASFNETRTGSSWAYVLLLILICVILYTIPALRLRLRNKEAFPSEKARVLAIKIFAAAFAVTLLLIIFNKSPAILLVVIIWTAVNYKILSGGSKDNPLKAPNIRSWADRKNAPDNRAFHFDNSIDPLKTQSSESKQPAYNRYSRSERGSVSYKTEDFNEQGDSATKEGGRLKYRRTDSCTLELYEENDKKSE